MRSRASTRGPPVPSARARPQDPWHRRGSARAAGRLPAVLALALSAVGPLVAPVRAQLDVSGYALGMGSSGGSSAWFPATTTTLGRGRLMVVAPLGPLELDLAYEHVATRRSDGQGLTLTAPGVSGVGDWLGTDWRIRAFEHGEWRHRLDRLSIGLTRGPVEVTLGRQAVSWANTLLLTPADPFVPFDPSDPFRVYRAGVDALRLRVSPGPFTELEAILRPTETASGTTASGLVRAQTSRGGWAFGAWGGMLHDEGALAAFATGAIGSTALRTEVALREAPGGGATVRGTLGIDRFFTAWGRDLYLVGELQYDGFGADSSSNLLEVALSKPFERGDMQTLGEWTVATQASYQVHPLVGIDGLVIANAADGSALLAPGVSWSATAAASVRAGVFLGLGDEGTPPFALGSEYGPIPPIAYASLTWFF